MVLASMVGVRDRALTVTGFAQSNERSTSAETAPLMGGVYECGPAQRVLGKPSDNLPF